MANVLFKKGLHAALPASRDAGTFYVTTDTHRLYLGDDLLSQAVETVANINALPSGAAIKVPGQFYYAIAENVLCTYDATQAKWIQINPDTYFKTSKATISTANNDGKAKLDITLEQTDKKGDKTEISSNPIAVTGESGVSVTATAEGLNIKGTTYSLGSSAETNGLAIKLLAAGTNTDAAGSVVLKGGANVTIDGNGNISAQDTIAEFKTKDSAITLGEGGYDVQIALGTKGQEVASSTLNLTLDPVIKYGANGTSSAHFLASKGGAQLNIYTKDEVDAIHTAMDAMRYLGVVTGTYDAPLFAGTALSASTFDIGDTFRVAKNLTGAQIRVVRGGEVESVNLHINDILIANGTEDSDGHITAETLYFDVIPGGVDSTNAITYIGSAQVVNGKAVLELLEKTGALTGDAVASLSIAAGANLKLEGVDASGKIQDFTIAHDVAGAAASTITGSNDVTVAAGADGEFTALTSISYDANGHIVSAATKKITITGNKLDGSDTHGTSAATVADVHNAAFAGSIMAADKSGALSGGNLAFHLTSSSLEFTKVDGADAKIGVNLVWGSF